VGHLSSAGGFPQIAVQLIDCSPQEILADEPVTAGGLRKKNRLEAAFKDEGNITGDHNMGGTLQNLNGTRALSK